MHLPSTTAIPLGASAAPQRGDVEQAARELETQFARMLIKTMRSASMGDPMLGNDTTYREMYDQQLATELTKGRGLGLAPMIARQLGRDAGAGAPGADAGAAAAGFRLHAPAAAPMPLPMPSAPALPAATTGSPPGILPLAPSSAGVSMPALDPGAAVAPQPAPAECPDAPLDCSSPEAFVQSIWPQAQKTAAELGVPARALVAQAALETGWGRRLAGREGESSHNLFGIKAGGGWDGERMAASTHEYVDGVRRTERADFRAYGSTADSFADYARLLRKPRYAGARGVGDDARRFASALQSAGYATDPHYAAKITAIANGATLDRALAALPATGASMAYASNAIAMAGTRE